MKVEDNYTFSPSSYIISVFSFQPSHAANAMIGEDVGGSLSNGQPRKHMVRKGEGDARQAKLVL